jgi:hypothetical protein
MKDGKIERTTRFILNLCKITAATNSNLLFKIGINMILKNGKFKASCPFKRNGQFAIKNLSVSTKSFPSIFIKNLGLNITVLYKAKIKSENSLINLIESKVMAKITPDD